MKKLIFSITLATFTLLGKAYDFKADGFYYNITSLSDLTVALCSQMQIGSFLSQMQSVECNANAFFTILSSKEWKVNITILPLGFNALAISSTVS